jgi:glycosyltransferase involved in cell wall biosynthesis
MITFCIPSKNNLRYLKSSITSIKNNSVLANDIIVYVDADNDGTEEWLKAVGVRYILNEEAQPKGIATGYNKCIEAATTDIVCMFHADMYMAKGFDIGLLKYLKPNSVISATRIEPPLHPEGKDKIIKQFGLYPEDFDKSDFDNFVDALITTNQNKTTRGIFAPWAIYKEDIISIGAHDEFFHSYHEDSDIFNRFILAGYDIIQSWDAYVYHLTCRGGQFQDGIEHVTKDTAFHQMKNTAARNYLRKWGSWIKNDEYQHPIILPKYNIQSIIKNCNEHLLEVLEPWFSCVYIDTDLPEIVYKYYQKEHTNTKYDLAARIKLFDKNLFSMDNIDILVEIDGAKFTQNTFNIIQQLSDIITESGSVGEFQLDNLRITITNMNTYEQDLVHL